jgi:hypothetical protein
MKIVSKNKKMSWLNFVLILTIYCFTNAQAKTPKSNDSFDLFIDYQVRSQIEYNETLANLEPFLNDYLNSKTYDHASQFWEKSDNALLTYQIDSILVDLKYSYPTCRPTLFALDTNKSGDEIMAKIILTQEFDKDISIVSSHHYTLKPDGADCFKFINSASNKLNNRKKYKKKNITFYLKDNEVSLDEIEKIFVYEQKLLDFFEVKPIDFNIASFKNTIEMYNVLGYDYQPAMYLNESIGGMFLNYDNFILSANNSPFYPHEMVHLYANEFTTIENSLISEGLATFLGGSLGHDYVYHLTNLQKYVIKNDINLLEYLTDESQYYTIIGKKSSFKYSAGAFLCHVIMECHDKKDLFELLKAKESSDELEYKLLDIFQSDKESLNQYLTERLKQFDKNDAFNL